MQQAGNPGGYTGVYAAPAGYVAYVGAPKKSWAVPWIGIGAIILSIFLPYISILGFEVTGLELMEFITEAASMVDSEGGGEGGSDDGDGMPGGALMIAIMMLAFSPFFYCLMGLLSIFAMLFGKHPLIFGILHLFYFGIFMLCSIISTVDLGILGSYSVHGDLTGIGFYIGGLAGIALCLKV